MDVVGLGTDLVEVERFRAALGRRASLAERLFSDAEREYAFRQYDPAESLAARFGAKEAVMKALGVGLWKFAFRDVEVVRMRSGEPTLALFGKAATLAAQRGVVGWKLSLSHTDTMAIAVVVALGDPAAPTGA
jgi:holo-[acyl-carrier protein] synthase